MLGALEVQNYKSLRDVGIDEFPRFAVLVGANAAGKSNFVDALDFLSTAMEFGLPAAVASRGGFGALQFRWRTLVHALVRLRISVLSPPELGVNLSHPETPLRYLFDYAFEIRPAPRSSPLDYVIPLERLEMTACAVDDDQALARAAVTRQENSFEIELPDAHAPREYFGVLHALQQMYAHSPQGFGGLAHDELVIGPDTVLGQIAPISTFVSELAHWGVYHFSPQTARTPAHAAMRPQLGPHGENLAAAIHAMARKHKSAFRELLEHLQVAVPSLTDVRTSYLDTKEMGLLFKEQGRSQEWLAQEVSDGTLQAVCLFLPLLHPETSLVVIEEPETSIHPWILQHFIDTCQEVAEDKQVVLTTHSPTAVDYVPLEALHVVRRDGGATSVEACEKEHPEMREVIRRSVLGLGETWRRGLVGGVPDDPPTQSGSGAPA